MAAMPLAKAIHACRLQRATFRSSASRVGFCTARTRNHAAARQLRLHVRGRLVDGGMIAPVLASGTCPA